MKKEIAGYLKLQVKGGEAKPGPGLGSSLGSKGVSVVEFCRQFNERTKDRQGKLLRVVVAIYLDKSFDFVVKMSPVSASIKEKAGISMGSGKPNQHKVGEISLAVVEEIARSKMEDFNTSDLRSAIKMVAGTARSMGVVVKE